MQKLVGDEARHLIKVALALTYYGYNVSTVTDLLCGEFLLSQHKIML